MTLASPGTHAAPHRPPTDLTPEDFDRYALAFRPSWEVDEAPPAAPTAAAPTAAEPVAAAEPVRGESRPRVNTLLMADAPAKPSAPLPAFDLPVSAVKLPPAPMSESDVAKTAVFKSVNASDIDLPDDYRPAGRKGRPALLIGLGIAAVLAILAAVAVMRGSPEEPKAPAAVAAPPPKTADIPPVEPATASPAPTTKPAATAAAKAAPAPAPEPVAAKPAHAPAAAKPAPPPAAAKPAPPPAAAKPAPPPAAAKPAAKGGIVRDAPF